MVSKNISQKKIVILATAIIVFIIFFIFIYFPTKANVRRLKTQLADVESQLSKIETFVKGKGSIEEGMRLLGEKQKKFMGYFPGSEENVLKMLSGFAKSFNIDIISLEPQPKAVFLDENNKPLTAGKKTFYKMLISINMRCSYRELVSYLEKFRESSEAYLTVEKLEINKNSADNDKLDIRLGFNMYMLI
jgi:cell division protein FtsL